MLCRCNIADLVNCNPVVSLIDLRLEIDTCTCLDKNSEIDYASPGFCASAACARPSAYPWVVAAYVFFAVSIGFVFAGCAVGVWRNARVRVIGLRWGFRRCHSRLCWRMLLGKPHVSIWVIARGKDCCGTCACCNRHTAGWAHGPSRSGRTANHPCANYVSGRARAAFLIMHIALCNWHTRGLVGRSAQSVRASAGGPHGHWGCSCAGVWWRPQFHP